MSWVLILSCHLLSIKGNRKLYCNVLSCISGALLNVSMLPEHVVGAGPLIKGLKGRLEVHLTVNHDNNTLTLGLTAKACVNSTCLFSKPVFNRTEIPGKSFQTFERR